jgi:hypothetical protein
MYRVREELVHMGGRYLIAFGCLGVLSPLLVVDEGVYQKILNNMSEEVKVNCEVVWPS